MGGEIPKMTTFTSEDREAAQKQMNAKDLAEKSFMDLWNSYTSKKMECEDLQDKLRQLQAENKKLKDFVRPILASGDDCVGNWDGGELQDLAAKSGLYVEKTMTEPCNLGKEEFVGCPCREYCYGDESWECYRIADFLLENEK
jgi:predicted nuclease with TOPRIM domain